MRPLLKTICIFPSFNKYVCVYARYNYSVPEFRNWWVECGIKSVENANGLIDGLFLDATPKVAVQHQLTYWKEMVDALRRGLGESAVIIDNGFFLTSRGDRLAGLDAWQQTGISYVESLTTVGSEGTTESESIDHLIWISNSSTNFSRGMLIGHGSMSNTDSFIYGLAKYLLVTNSSKKGYFLANTNYSIDGGLLRQPHMNFYYNQGASCGEPLTSYFESTVGSSYFWSFILFCFCNFSDINFFLFQTLTMLSTCSSLWIHIVPSL